MWEELLIKINEGDIKALSRSISLVENEFAGYEDFLKRLNINKEASVIGITGPPGAGKSTLTDALIGSYLESGTKKIAVLCVDPSSPFNYGALLGDRIRMSGWYNNPAVFIRSIATRGSLGGLSANVIEITDVLKGAGYEKIIIETVGVGQSEVEIAGIADTTIVVLVPESGDEVQTMKAGIMEIADIFVVNKSDRADADIFIKNLQQMLAPAFNKKNKEIEIVKTVGTEKAGIDLLVNAIAKSSLVVSNQDKKLWLLAQKALKLIQKKKMGSLTLDKIKDALASEQQRSDFNLYQFVESL